MRKLIALAAMPITASAFTLYLWAKIMESFDDMLVGLGDNEEDWEYDDLVPTLPPRIEGTDAAQKAFDLRMWNYYMDKQFNGDG